MKHPWMTKLAMAFETPADGGGTAVAITAAPAPVAPAAPAPSAAKPKGMFDRVMPASLKRLPGGSEDPNRVKPPVVAKPDAAKPASADQTFNVLADDGKTVLGNFKTQAEAEAFMKERTENPNASAKPTGKEVYNVLADDGKTVLGSFKTEAEAQTFMDAQAGTTGKPDASEALPRKLMGRYGTFKEAEEAYRRTEVEASRLFHENKTLKETHTKALADREAEVLALKAEIETARATPAFRELSKEELAELAKTDPVAAAEYIADKKFRDRDAATAKQAAERNAREKTERLKDTNRQIEAHRAEMQKDAENFPQFEDMAPVMNGLFEMTSDKSGATPLQGHVWAEELLYLAALGYSHRAALKNGKGVVKDAAKKAMTIAAASAAASSGPVGGGAGKGSGASQQDAAKESKGSRIVKAAPRTRFFGGKPQT